MFSRAMREGAAASAPWRSGRRQPVERAGSGGAVPVGGAGLAGTLSLLPGARGLVIWLGPPIGSAQAGPGRSGHPGRGEVDAPGEAGPPDDGADFPRLLAAHGLATLRLEACRHRRTGPSPAGDDDFALLAEQAVQALDWVAGQRELAALATGFCACGAAAAGALLATTQRPARVEAVVAASGRVELAAAALARVVAPTLLVVGGNDIAALAANRAALPELRCEKRLEVVPGAGAHFEEPGARATLIHLAAAWLAARLGGGVRH